MIFITVFGIIALYILVVMAIGHIANDDGLVLVVLIQGVVNIAFILWVLYYFKFLQN